MHSSVGAYVNLWDYIAKGSKGTHTLKFYYTERGLSGSTCYMQFTLPSVSSNTPEYQNSQLKIEKKVEGAAADKNKEFDFAIKIRHETQDVEDSDYSIVRYSPKGDRLESWLLTNGEGTFKLKADEYVIIDYLQHGTQYEITETDCPGYTVTTKVLQSNNLEEARTVKNNATRKAEGEIEQGQGGVVTFTNTARPELPETGGSGTLLYTTGGTALLAAALLYDIRRRKAQRSKPQ